MKYTYLNTFPVAVSLLLLVACGETPKKESTPADEPESAQSSSVNEGLPGELVRVLDAHGGLEQWREQRTLIYEMPRDSAVETHTIDLRTRKDCIDGGSFSMGFDGEHTWIHDPDSTYQGNPEFYHNLMFYFYAMPFVLADPGIRYGEAPDLEFEGDRYPGIRISYGDGVGTSPEDEYFLHYDPQSGRMAWLGYTVTYFDGEPSEDVHWIRYDNWETFNGLLLPRSISWYNYEGREIRELRNTVEFENVRVSEIQTDPAHFEKPEGGEYYTSGD